MTERIVLSVDRCTKHRDFYAICITRGNLGQRLTPSKCCGVVGVEIVEEYCERAAERCSQNILDFGAA